jgi:hypothetical protein
MKCSGGEGERGKYGKGQVVKGEMPKDGVTIGICSNAECAHEPFEVEALLINI